MCHPIVCLALKSLIVFAVCLQMLMEHSVTRLAPFFGRTRANDVLLSHMITFLNDKEVHKLK